MSVVAYSDNVMPNEEFTAFVTEARKKARSEWKKDDAARLDAPLGLLLEVLHAKYQGSVAALVDRAKQAGENVKFSASISEALSKWGELSRATLSKHGSILKRVLAMLDFPAGFLDSLRMLPAKKQVHDKTLGKWGSFPADHQRVCVWKAGRKLFGTARATNRI